MLYDGFWIYGFWMEKRDFLSVLCASGWWFSRGRACFLEVLMFFIPRIIGIYVLWDHNTSFASFFCRTKNVFSAPIFEVENPRINANLSQSRSVTPDSHKPSACSWHSHVLRSCFRLSCFCSLAIRHRPAERDWLRFALIRGFSLSLSLVGFILLLPDNSQCWWERIIYAPEVQGLRPIFAGIKTDFEINLSIQKKSTSNLLKNSKILKNLVRQFLFLLHEE